MATEEDRVAAAVADKLTGEHRRWIEDFAEQHDSTFAYVMEGAREYLATGESIYFGVDLDYAAADEFWMHYEQMSGEQIPEEKREQPFRCAC
jgi:hypothetical protein